MASANDLRALRGNGWAYAHGANVAPPTRVHDELEEVSSRCNTSSCESPFQDARLRARASPCPLPACTPVQHPRLLLTFFRWQVARRHPLASLPLVVVALRPAPVDAQRRARASRPRRRRSSPLRCCRRYRRRRACVERALLPSVGAGALHGQVPPHAAAACRREVARAAPKHSNHSANP